jgi:hypothetical protein
VRDGEVTRWILSAAPPRVPDRHGRPLGGDRLPLIGTTQIGGRTDDDINAQREPRRETRHAAGWQRDRPGAHRLGAGTTWAQPVHRPSPGRDRALRWRRGREHRGPLRNCGRARARGARRRAQHRGLLLARWRTGHRPDLDALRRRDRAPRPRARTGGRQPDRRRGRARRRKRGAHRCGLSARAVVGAARWRRELRRGHRAALPAALCAHRDPAARCPGRSPTPPRSWTSTSGGCPSRPTRSPRSSP